MNAVFLRTRLRLYSAGVLESKVTKLFHLSSSKGPYSIPYGWILHTDKRSLPVKWLDLDPVNSTRAPELRSSRYLNSASFADVRPSGLQPSTQVFSNYKVRHLRYKTTMKRRCWYCCNRATLSRRQCVVSSLDFMPDVQFSVRFLLSLYDYY